MNVYAYIVVLQLYGEFAEVFDLYECKLAIVHCAGHEDAALVDSLWQSIINTGMHLYYVCIVCFMCVCMHALLDMAKFLLFPDVLLQRPNHPQLIVTPPHVH